MAHEIFLLFSDDWIVSEIILQQKYPLYHLRKKNHLHVECKIVDSEISDAEEKVEEKFDETQDIKSQDEGHEEVGSPEEKEVKMMKI